MTRGADLEQTLSEKADKGRTVSPSYELQLADELIDAARSERLITAGVIGFPVRIPTLNVADRYTIAYNYEWVDRRIADVAGNVRQAARRIAPPFPHLLAQEPFPKQWQIGGSDCSKLVDGGRHPQVSFAYR
jgi:hypothetical protein